MNIFAFLKNIASSIFVYLYYVMGYIRASLMGVKLGKGAKISPKASLKNAYYIGNATIGSTVVLGEGSYINSGQIITGTIGKYCSIAYNVIIGPTEHDTEFITMSPSKAIKLGLFLEDIEKDKLPPIIEDEVWIGANVIVLKGVIIGTGAVIAAGAVVTKNIPPMEIWGGVPARFIKERKITLQQTHNKHNG